MENNLIAMFFAILQFFIGLFFIFSDVFFKSGIKTNNIRFIKHIL